MKDFSVGLGPIPYHCERAPRTTDVSLPGKVWVDEKLDDVYIFTSTKNGQSVWIGVGGGAETLSSLTVTGNGTFSSGNLSIGTGNLDLAAGTLTLGALDAGVVQTNASGQFSSSKGTDGQLLIGSTASVPAWGNITSTGGSCVITNGSNTINIEATGGTANSYVTDAGGPVSPLAGALTIIGYDSNITTNGATANTVKIKLADSISVAGALTAGVNLNMTSGTATITSSTNAAKSIYLHANAGTTETIELHADQGNAADSIYLHSDVGGLTFDSGLASADAINIKASNAAGGIDMDCGSAGFNLTAANGPIDFVSGTGAMTFGADAVQKSISLGNATGNTSLLARTGTGAMTFTAGGVLDLDAVGAISMNSSTGDVNVANDAVAQNVNIATGAAAKVISVGNSSGATSFTLNIGTEGALALGTNATDHNTSIGSITGVSTFDARSGTGAMTFTAGGDIVATAVGKCTIDTGGVLELNSSAGIISIANDAVNQNVNIATAGVRVLSLGSSTGASQTDVICGTSGLNLGTSANAHITTLGSTNTTSSTVVQSGSTGISINSGGVLDIDATGILSLNSSAAAINIGNDAVSQAVNIAIAGERVLTLGSTTTASQTVVDCGSAGASFGASANAHVTTIGSTNTTSSTVIQAGSTGISLSAAGMVSMTPATDSVEGVAITINARVVHATFTGQTTAAAASQEFTINNSTITDSTTAIMVTAANLGANDAQMTVTRVVPSTGAVVVTLTNNGAAALNGNVHITLWVLN